MTFQAWIPPAGETVDPPVHPLTVVDVIYSDGGKDTYIPARDLNWSGEGDGPKIIAYSVVEEYVEKREPREWWLVGECSVKGTEAEAQRFLEELREANPKMGFETWKPIHVREVLPEAPAKPAPREVVAWAVVDDPTDKVEVIRAGVTLFFDEGKAMEHQRHYGGTVRPLGFLP